MRNVFSLLLDWRQEIGYRLESRHRSNDWAPLRDEHMREHSACIACGRRGEEVHHGVPVKYSPARELDPTNLYTYCCNDHRGLAHLGDTATHNPEHALLAKIKRACVARYRDELPSQLNLQEGVIYRTVLDAMHEEFETRMSDHVAKALKTVQRFVDKQRPQK
jgi:hypothetical protein